MDQEDILFGQIAVAMRLLTKDELRQALAQQQRHPEQRLGEACLSLKLMTLDDLERILEVQTRRRAQRMATERPANLQPPPRPPAESLEVQIDLSQMEQLRKAAEPSQRPASEGAPLEGRAGREGLPSWLDTPSVGDARPAVSERSTSDGRPSWLDAPSVGDGKRASPQRAPEEPPDWLDVSEAVGLDAEKRARQRQEEQPRGTESHLRAVEAGRAPRVDSLLRRMVELGGSDLHLSSTNPPMLRLHGSLVPLGEGPSAFPPDALREQLYAILPERLRGEFESTSDVDFAYAVAGVARFRVNCFLDHKGIGAAFRQIPLEILSPAQLGLPRQVLNLCQPGKGLVLVAGPTGSGKSTTLASLVNHINGTHDLHIITIEDPIEFVHANKQCLINQREVGVHTLSFARALRAALREDPDVVLVGELQDPETIAIALETAETGHLVLGALRTASAASTVDRILDQFPADRQARIRTMLCDTLRGVVAQALCRRKGGGRVAAFEVLMSTPAVASLIREGNTQQIPSTMQAGKELGMQLLNDHLVELVRAGTVEPREACLLSYDRATIRAALSRLGLSI